MATSSIFTNIRIRDAETAERFITALEASERESQNTPREHVARQVTDANEIRELYLKWKRNNGNIN